MVFLRGVFTVGGLTLCSRILGFLRDILMAAGLGAGLVADAFFVAFKLPNLFRRLFAEGAFSAAFVPIFSRELEQHGRPAAAVFASQAMTALFWVSLIFLLIMEAAMPWVLRFLAPGFIDDPVKFALTLETARVTFPYLAFIALVALLGGVLNSVNRFAAMAAAPILLNLCMIAALLPLFSGSYNSAENGDIWGWASTQTPGDPAVAHRLAQAVFIAGALQLIWMLSAARRAGIQPNIWSWSWSPRLREMLRRLLPVTLGAGVYQVNLVVDIILASLLAQGSVSFLYYADRVNQLPLGVIGVAVGTIVLPLLSRHIASGQKDQAAAIQDQAIIFALLFAVPAAVGLLILADPITVILFERGAFSAVESRNTASALAAFTLGLPAYVLVKVLSPAFFARGDTATPVRAAIAALVVNVVFNLVLMGPLAHVGLALASSIAAWFNTGYLAWNLRKQGYLTFHRQLRHQTGLIAVAAGAMAGALLLGLTWAGPFIARSGYVSFLAVIALVGGGGLFYVALACWFGLADGWRQVRRSNPPP